MVVSTLDAILAFLSNSCAICPWKSGGATAPMIRGIESGGLSGVKGN